MQIVIDIPEEIKKKRDARKVLSNDEIATVCVAIKKGTPLPKGHGRLIDVGQCDRKLFYQQCGGADSLITVKSAFDMLMSLPTIIKEDKAESEG